MRSCFMPLIVVALCVPGPLVAQEPAESEALQALRQELRERKRDVGLTWLLADLMERGAGEDAALGLVEKIDALTAGRPLDLERTRRHDAYEFQVSDPEAASSFADSVRDFRRDMLEAKATRAGTYKGGPGCLQQVKDCIDRVDQIYNDCLDAGLSYPYCLDLWLDLIGVCEALADECAPG